MCAFEEAGVRAHPDVEIDDIVRVSGRAEERDDGLQVEAESLTVLDGEEAAAVESDLDAALAEAAEPADVEPLVEWPAFEKLWDDLREVRRNSEDSAFGPSDPDASPRRR